MLNSKTIDNILAASCIISVEDARYIKYGHIISVYIQCNTGSISGFEETLFSRLPKPLKYMRFAAFAASNETGKYSVVRAAINGNGQIINAYTDTSILSNSNLCIGVTYISEN